MTTKIIKIEVPLSWEEPPELNTFKPEENAFILTTGSEIIKDARNLVAGLSQKEIYNKIREETKEEIKKLDKLLELNMNDFWDICDQRDWYYEEYRKLKDKLAN
jgi:hypothetical protein